MQCGLGTKFCELVIEYIDMFYEEHQVVDDLRPFFKLLKKEDTNMFKEPMESIWTVERRNYW